MTQTLTHPPQSLNAYPDFLAQKVNAFYEGRVANDWKGRHILRGRVPPDNAIQLMSNDYLDIANHPSVLAAQREVLEQADNYVLMSGIFLHDDHDPQLQLEARFRDFMQAGDAVLCQSGYNANIGLIQAVVANTGAPIYVDLTAHMSLWDGVRLAERDAIPFRHNDVDHLQSLIRRHGPGFVIVDSVYSTNGSVCPLTELVNMAYERGCILLVDESHSLGTHGPQGRGLVVELGLTDKVMFRSASLAKAFVGRAGIITCPKGFGDYFKFTSSPAIFSSTLLPHEIAGLNETLSVIMAADDRRKRLHYNTHYLREHLGRLGYNVEEGSAQIIAIEAGTEWDTILLRDALEARGVFGSVFCAPATAKKRALVRFSINAGLTDLQLKRVVDACAQVRDECGMWNWRSTKRKQRMTRKAEAFRQATPLAAVGCD